MNYSYYSLCGQSFYSTFSPIQLHLYLKNRYTDLVASVPFTSVSLVCPFLFSTHFNGNLQIDFSVRFFVMPFAVWKCSCFIGFYFLHLWLYDGWCFFFNFFSWLLLRSHSTIAEWLKNIWLYLNLCVAYISLTICTIFHIIPFSQQNPKSKLKYPFFFSRDTLVLIGSIRFGSVLFDLVSLHACIRAWLICWLFTSNLL